MIFEGLTGSMSRLRWFQGTEERSSVARRGVEENRPGGSGERRLEVERERERSAGVDRRLRGDSEDNSGILLSDNTCNITT